MDALDRLFALLDGLFALVCGRGRCFVIDGAALPVCQRCLGLYAGATLTGIWLIAAGLWRRGLPSRRVVAVQALLLILALLGGVHVLDLGPAWRLLCGLWTGHVVLVWLVGAGGQMRAAGRALSGCATESARGWTRAANRQALAAPAILALFALVFARYEPPGRRMWTAVAAVGAVALALAALLALAAGVGTIFRRVRRGRVPGSGSP